MKCSGLAYAIFKKKNQLEINEIENRRPIDKTQ
jgi:hypothetical protein